MSQVLTDADMLRDQLAEAAEAGQAAIVMPTDNLTGQVRRLNLLLVRLQTRAVHPLVTVYRLGSINLQKATYEKKLSLLNSKAGNLLSLALRLEARLEEIESQVRVLQLVSVTIELLGDRAQPFLGIVAEAIPKVILQI